MNGGVYKIGSDRNPYDVISPSGLNIGISPKGGNFVGSQTITITANNATSAWYKVGSGAQVAFTNSATFTIGEDMNIGESVTVSWSATDGSETKTGSAIFTKVDKLTTEWHIYFDDSSSNWGKVNCYIYGSNECNEITGKWPGTAMTFNGEYFEYVVETEGALNECNVIFSNGSGDQTGDNVKIRNYGIYNKNGDTGKSSGLIGINIINGNDANAPTEYYNLQGIRIQRPTSPGIYIIKKGNKASKTIIR